MASPAAATLRGRQVADPGSCAAAPAGPSLGRRSRGDLPTALCRPRRALRPVYDVGVGARPFVPLLSHLHLRATAAGSRDSLTQPAGP